MGRAARREPGPERDGERGVPGVGKPGTPAGRCLSELINMRLLGSNLLWGSWERVDKTIMGLVPRAPRPNIGPQPGLVDAAGRVIWSG